MPILRLRKEGFNPYRTFPYGLAVGFSVAVAPHPFEVLLLKAASYPPSLLALRAATLERARVAGGGLGSIPDGSLLVVVPLSAQGLALGAGVEIFFGVVNELILAEEGTTFVVFWLRYVGAHTGFLHPRHVFDGAVGGIAGDRA
jgi:hypothetical protein